MPENRHKRIILIVIIIIIMIIKKKKIFIHNFLFIRVYHCIKITGEKLMQLFVIYFAWKLVFIINMHLHGCGIFRNIRPLHILLFQLKVSCYRIRLFTLFNKFTKITFFFFFFNYEKMLKQLKLI